MEFQRNWSVPEVAKCSTLHRENQRVISDLDGTLLRETSSFPYYMLIALEAGGLLRAAMLLAASPLIWLVYNFMSEAAGIKMLIFITFRGLKVKEIESVARAVLPKFLIEDLHSETWRVFSAFGKRYVVTENPRIMIEHFAKEYLEADAVLGTEVAVTLRRVATGFVQKSGVLVGRLKAQAMVKELGDFQHPVSHPDARAEAMAKRFRENKPDVGLGDRRTDSNFLSLCKEAYVVPSNVRVPAVARERLPKPLVFHDGRLVRRPTPLVALYTLLWAPVGFALAVARMAAGCLLPMSLVYYAYRCLGIRVVVKGRPPAANKGRGESKLGVLFVCSHRTLLDPIFLSVALGRPVTAVTYSISRLSEFLSPIRTVALTRDREADAAKIQKLLEEGDLAICPEGTTCREPYLLRFSSLFAELADRIVPVAMVNRMSMFHGTTVRGWKGLDPFFFFMNPFPVYEVTFLEQLPPELTCAGGKTAHQVANHIQRLLADTLSFECTQLTRADKYQVLAGNDGSVAARNATTGSRITAAL